MKKILLLSSFLITILYAFSSCKKKEDVIQCNNGYMPNSDNNCACLPGNIEAYGQCLPDDETVFFGVSEGCPCMKDSLLMRILGKTTTPNSNGQFKMVVKYANTIGFETQTVFAFVPTAFGYDSLVPTVFGHNTYCNVDGWQYQRQVFGRIYNNDSIVFHFFYTRPNLDNPDKLIYLPDTCSMVIRN